MSQRRAFVGSDDGVLFDAHVEYSVKGPFPVLPGPKRASRDLAIAWARAHAPEVLVRIGDEMFSAGKVRSLGLTPLPAPGCEWRQASEGNERRWLVEAATSVLPDGPSEPLRAAVRAALIQADINCEIRVRAAGLRLEVDFPVQASDELAANEQGFTLLRGVWESIPQAAVTYDLSSMSVRTLPA